MTADYRRPAGGMWSHKDQNGRIYYFISAHAEGKEYKYRAFINSSKKGKQPDFTLYALDNGEGVPIRFIPRPSRSSEEEQAPYKGQVDGSNPSGTKDKYQVEDPGWPDNDANEEAESDDKRMEDGGNGKETEEEDDLPY